MSHQKIEADDDGRTYQLGRRGALCLLPALRSLFGSHFQCHCKYLHCSFSSAGVQKFIQVDFHTLLLLVVSVERTGFYYVYSVVLLRSRRTARTPLAWRGRAPDRPILRVVVSCGNINSQCGVSSWLVDDLVISLERLDDFHSSAVFGRTRVKEQFVGDLFLASY